MSVTASGLYRLFVILVMFDKVKNAKVKCAIIACVVSVVSVVVNWSLNRRRYDDFWWNIVDELYASHSLCTPQGGSLTHVGRKAITFSTQLNHCFTKIWRMRLLGPLLSSFILLSYIEWIIPMYPVSLLYMERVLWERLVSVIVVTVRSVEDHEGRLKQSRAVVDAVLHG